MLLPDIPDRALCDRRRPSGCSRILGQPVESTGQTIEVGVSIGIAFDRSSMETVDELLSDADIAMYQAKARGKGRYHVFVPSDETQAAIDRDPPGRIGADGPPARRDVEAIQAGRARRRARLSGRRTAVAARPLEREEPDPGPMEIPLFPLHTVLCPGIVLPLHVFEDRYRALTRALPGDRGAVRHRPDPRGPRGRRRRPTPTLAGVGALVEIREAGRYPDGRYDLLAAATGRFAIEFGRSPAERRTSWPTSRRSRTTSATRPAPSAWPRPPIRRFVRYLELMRIREGETGEALDIRVELDSSPAPTSRIRSPRTSGSAGRATELRGPIGPASRPCPIDDDPAPDDGAGLAIPDDPTVLSYLLSGIVQVELPRRQRLLEAATTVERLEQLLVLLDREVFLLAHRLRCFTPDRHACRRRPPQLIAGRADYPGGEIQTRGM